MGFFKNLFIKEDRRTDLEKIDPEKIPKHIAIIMDGNGRWAKKRSLPRSAGHKAGVEALREVIKTCSNLNVQYLTLYAFSTENWKRPEEEVSALMNLLVYYLRNEIQELNENNVRINTLGDINKLPNTALIEIEAAQKLTRNNTGLTVNIALNYGGRLEIINAVKSICIKVINKEIEVDQIDERYFSDHLYTKNVPDPDLVIRPSGELRISNFLLWQIAYSEFWFSKIFWPDFNGEYLVEAILDYQGRDRRYGGAK
ncbi:isoprenyl transferase [Geosporobacter ferrireducens]|uniref:Isoprenyl transferase n=1 Tax=Geosporobacter ferrireducens TaxID=1424294 RepID=A0A1D8GBF8_9FIRM|nr:isoprenyl transferase [Geosporobacter ferrireducens]AOT68245.1 isoprenyl transferase [Geosporobacter ferrireducens]MTI57335.1 isoprenyl transferase [Geosporobacter ferrireducens]